MGLFGNNKQKTTIKGKKLTLDYHGVLKNMKKERVEQCQRNGTNMSQMGMDLVHLEKKTRVLYNASVKYIKDGHSHDEAYENIMNEHASSDVDRLIVEKLFKSK